MCLIVARVQVLTSFHCVAEFKRDKTAEEALKQIEDKDYTLPFVSDQRKLFKIGVSFDSQKRMLDGWKVGR